jgi:hypothetical protein
MKWTWLAGIGLCALLCVAAGGCQTAPVVTTELIVQGSQSLDAAKASLDVQHAKIDEFIDAQDTALDTAFDLDVMRCEAGEIKDANGVPVKLTSRWIISARQGYAAQKEKNARSKVVELIAHQNDVSNVEAGKKSLDRARTLIIMQQKLGDDIKNMLLNTAAKEISK